MRNFNVTKLVGLLALAGCQGIPEKAPEPVPDVIYKTKTVDTACSWTSLINISKNDVLTADTARQILAHDTSYQRHCTTATAPK